MSLVIKIHKSQKITFFLIAFLILLIVTTYFCSNYTILINEYNDYFIANTSAKNNDMDLKYCKVKPCNGLNKMKHLENLDIIGCSNYDFLNYMPKLRKLTIWTNDNGTIIDKFPYSPQIEELIIQNDYSSLDFKECVGKLPHLKSICFVKINLDIRNQSISELIFSCLELTEIHPIGTSDQWYGFEKIKNLENLEFLNLLELDIADISPLKECHSLKNLSVKIGHQEDMSVISEITTLEKITIWHNGTRNNILSLDSSISGLISLDELSLSGFEITNIDGLINLTQLKKIALNSCLISKDKLEIIKQKGIELKIN